MLVGNYFTDYQVSFFLMLDLRNLVHDVLYVQYLAVCTVRMVVGGGPRAEDAARAVDMTGLGLGKRKGLYEVGFLLVFFSNDM